VLNQTKELHEAWKAMAAGQMSCSCMSGSNNCTCSPGEDVEHDLAAFTMQPKANSIVNSTSPLLSGTEQALSLWWAHRGGWHHHHFGGWGHHHHHHWGHHGWGLHGYGGCGCGGLGCHCGRVGEDPEDIDEDVDMEALFGEVFGNVTLTSEVALESGRCGGLAAAANRIAPGCLGQCEWSGVCSAVNHVAGTWLRTHDKAKVTKQICSHKGAFECLLWNSHKKKCQRLLNRGSSFGIPTRVGQLRRKCR